MPKRIAFIHTVSSLVGLFNDLSRELLSPDLELFHISDEILLKVVLAQGGLSPFIYQRVAEHVIAAERAGCEVVQCTCSSISPCVEAVRPLVGIPVLKIDEPMVQRALQIGRRIGIAATAPTTLRPTADLVNTQAAVMGCSVQIDPVLCEGAFAALSAGDPAAHDRIVVENVQKLVRRNDVVILAQASMGRVIPAIPEEDRVVPILASPRSAVEKLVKVLG